MNRQDDNKIKVKVGIHYLKDLSVESANAPYIFSVEGSSAPKININYDLSVAKLSSKDGDISSFEVTISLEINSNVQDKTGKEHSLFIFEAKYGGIFSLQGVYNDDEEKRALFVYAPNILFPFLRRIVTTNTGDCGFPPLMLEPIDFSTQFERQHYKKEE